MQPSSQTKATAPLASAGLRVDDVEEHLPVDACSEKVALDDRKRMWIGRLPKKSSRATA
jgi:hypothetical protein